MNLLSKIIVFTSSIFMTTIPVTHAAEDINDNVHWQYSLTPYAWFAGVKGDMATVPGLP